MTKTLAELQALCDQNGLTVPPTKRPAKEPYLRALQDHLWAGENPGRSLPEQIQPMLLGDWNDLQADEVTRIEDDRSGWCVQEKADGVRALIHITDEGVRITGRTLSDVTFRLSEYQANLAHFFDGFRDLAGTILDGELVCPKAVVHTGDTTTSHPLQATVAILATIPENARSIQAQQDCHVCFVAFDVLRFRGQDVTNQPLRERLGVLETAYLMASNPFLTLAETHIEEKALFHELVIAEGKEGTVWKQLDQAYCPGRRARHWLKRKKEVAAEAVVTGFKAGTPGKGNENLIGAVEFSTVDGAGVSKPIAWVSSWTDQEREQMTSREAGPVTLSPGYLGRRALVAGHDVAGKSGRYRHARFVKWLDAARVMA